MSHEAIIEILARERPVEPQPVQTLPRQKHIDDEPEPVQPLTTFWNPEDCL